MSPASQDRDWLGFDGAEDDAAPQGAAAGAPPPHDPVATSPWLRHDLSGGTSGVDPGEGPATGPDSGRDPAWLAPELEVPHQQAPAEEAHDTGVPPTLTQEPFPVQPSDPAGGAAHDEPVATRHGAPSDHPSDHASDPSSDPSSDHASDPGVDPASLAGPDGPADRTIALDQPSGEPVDEPVEETAPRHGHDDGQDHDEEEAGLLAVAGAAVKEFAIVVGMALVLSFIVKTWLLQAFYIPSGSMEDTLVLNDRVIVSKLTPGPIDLKRGDIIVFADPGQWLEETPAVPHGKLVTVAREAMTFVGLLPDNSENHLIKRVIGLPGDHVVCCDEGGRITVNGTAIKEPYLKPGDSASDQDFDITVPSGRVWVMGDHRSNSADSRAHDAPENNGSQGSVDERLIVGRAVALVWPLDHMTWLSNPTTTFAKVPAPASDGGSPSTEVPQSDPGSTSGGAEVTGDGEGGG